MPLNSLENLRPKQCSHSVLAFDISAQTHSTSLPPPSTLLLHPYFPTKLLHSPTYFAFSFGISTWGLSCYANFHTVLGKKNTHEMFYTNYFSLWDFLVFIKLSKVLDIAFVSNLNGFLKFMKP